MTNQVVAYSRENGGRVLLLFLLFCLAIYEFLHSGYSAFSDVRISPFLILAVYSIFKWKMAAFWALIFINYFLQMKSRPFPLPQGVPMSLWDEMLELILIAIAIIDARQKPHFGKCVNLMLFAVLI